MCEAVPNIYKILIGYYRIGERDLLKHRKRTTKQGKLVVYLCKLLSDRRNAEIGKTFSITTHKQAASLYKDLGRTITFIDYPYWREGKKVACEE